MTDARRYERVPFVRDATLVDDDGARVPINTTDLSEGGVGIFCETRAYEAGARVALQLAVADGERPETIVGVVRFVSAELEGTRMGIEFARPLCEPAHPRLWDCLQHALARLTRCDG